jgi:hypothetical protein
MARVLYTGILDDLKGSIAGTTFQHNASGRIAKGRSNQRFSSSVAQTGTQNNFATIAMRWRGLSVANRALWDAIALAHPRTDKWGVIKTLSGFQYQLAANRNLLTIGQALQNAPATYVSPLTVPAYTIAATSSALYFNFTAPPVNLTGYELLVFASPPTQSISPKSRVSRRLITMTTGGAVYAFEFLASYIAVYPLVWATLYTTGHCVIQFYACTISIATGLISPWNVQKLAIG